MKRLLPSLAALEAFEAVARLGHVTRAAEELGRTQSAVSRQIANLEAFARRPLFVRDRKRLILNEAGKWYAGSLARLLNDLETDTAQLITFGSEDRRLRLGLLPTFGSRWLIPRLHRFPAAQLGIELNILTTPAAFDMDAIGLDVAIRFGDGQWPDVVSHRLIDEELVAVCAPSLAGRRLEDLDWLHLVHRPQDWPTWLHATSNAAAVKSGLKIENITVAIEAACRGLGVALLPALYIGEELASGRLAAPFGDPIASGAAFYLVHRPAKEAKAAAFRDWALAEASAQ